MDGRSGAVRESRTYERDASDVLAMEDDIARATVDALRLRLLPDSAAPLVTGGTRNPRAREAYYRGLARAALRTPSDAAIAQKYFELATTLDPGFARAWAGRAFAAGVQDDGKRRQPLAGEVVRFARQALKLDSTLADPHVILANMSTDPATQRREVDEALRLEPGNREALYSSSAFFVFAGDRPRARAGAERLLAVDPVSPTSHFMAATVLNYLGENARADSLAAEGARLDSLGFGAPEPAPKWPPYWNRGVANLLLRKYDRAAEYLGFGESKMARATRAVLAPLASYSRDGSISADERRRALLLLRHNEPNMQRWLAAVLYLQLEDRDDMYRILATLRDQPGVLGFAVWDVVRNESRFRELEAAVAAGRVGR